MTNDPITPPPELVQQIRDNAVYGGDDQQSYGLRLITAAYRAGADQELEACCEYLTSCAAWEPEDVQELFDHRRPKPLSLHELALQMLGTIERDAHYLPEITDTIRKALESQPS